MRWQRPRVAWQTMDAKTSQQVGTLSHCGIASPFCGFTQRCQPALDSVEVLVACLAETAQSWCCDAELSWSMIEQGHGQQAIKLTAAMLQLGWRQAACKISEALISIAVSRNGTSTIAETGAGSTIATALAVHSWATWLLSRASD